MITFTPSNQAVNSFSSDFLKIKFYILNNLEIFVASMVIFIILYHLFILNQNINDCN